MWRRHFDGFIVFHSELKAGGHSQQAVLLASKIAIPEGQSRPFVRDDARKFCECWKRSDHNSTSFPRNCTIVNWSLIQVQSIRVVVSCDSNGTIIRDHPETPNFTLHVHAAASICVLCYNSLIRAVLSLPFIVHPWRSSRGYNWLSHLIQISCASVWFVGLWYPVASAHPLTHHGCFT